MKHPLFYLLTSLIISHAGTAQTLLTDDFDYSDGELNTASYLIWSAYDADGVNPYAEISNRALVMDYTTGSTFAGEYQTRSPGPEQKVIMYSSFYLTVTEPVLDEVGATFCGLAEIDCRGCYRGRVFMKKGEAPNTYRLGLASQVSSVFTAEGWINTHWYAQDLKLNETYFVSTYWHNDDLISRLYIDTEDSSQPAVEVVGGTPRRNAMRRFGIIMDSNHHLGRIVMDNLRIAENWEGVSQPVIAKDPFEVPFRTYEDPLVGNYQEVGGGWSLWYPTIGEETWGFLYMPMRNNSGTGWHFHGTQGWVYLAEGNMTDGLYGYVAGLEWVFTREDFAGTFYSYRDGAYYYWQQPR
jgi:hypothetical protein